MPLPDAEAASVEAVYALDELHADGVVLAEPADAHGLAIGIGVNPWYGITDPERIADMLELRLKRHPRMIAAILRSEGLPAKPAREDLTALASKLAMVEITPGVA